MVQCEKCAKSRKVTEPDRRILREAPFQIVRQRLTPGRIPGEGQCKRSAILHLPHREEFPERASANAAPYSTSRPLESSRAAIAFRLASGAFPKKPSHSASPVPSRAALSRWAAC